MDASADILHYKQDQYLLILMHLKKDLKPSIFTNQQFKITNPCCFLIYIYLFSTKVVGFMKVKMLVFKTSQKS